MSHLARPRVHFGGSFLVDVGTANNDDVLDRPEVVDTAAVTVRPTPQFDDEQFHRWMRDRTDRGDVRAGWNYLGDNQCEFVGVSVTAVEPRDTAMITEVGSDPLVGARVRLGLAVMVDLDPKGFASTQIFADSFEVRQGDSLRLAGRPGRFHSRWLNLRRNLGLPGFAAASAVFQAAIPAADLDFETAGSAALEALRTEVARGAGLSIRFCVYRLAPRQPRAARAETDEAVSTPAVGRVVGTLGVWREGEPASVAMGRLLVPSSSTIVDKVPIVLGPAVAVADPGRVTLDLVNAFPEVDGSGAKADLGAATLRVRDGTRTLDLGPVGYDQTAYEASSGVVEVRFDPALDPAVAAGELLLTTEKAGELMAEAPVMVESDDRCLYLRPGEIRTARFTALARGAPLAEPVRLEVVAEPGADAPGPVVETAAVIEVDAAGGVLALRAVGPGCVVIRLAAGSSVRPLDPARDTFVNVRVLPDDDYDHVGDDELTFGLVYREVLRYYHLLHPAMSAVFDLSDEQVVTAAAESLLRRTDPAAWHRAHYMPRTRDLSPGKRRLLERWCHQVLDQ